MAGKVTASFNINGHEQKNIPVINPSDWFGKAFVLEHSGSYYVAEGGSIQDVIDELADSDKYKHLIEIDIDVEGDDYGESVTNFDDDAFTPEQLTKIESFVAAGVPKAKIYRTLKNNIKKNYASEPCYAGNNSIPCDIENLLVHGNESVQHGKGSAYKMLYHAEGLPKAGVDPVDFYNNWEWVENDDDSSKGCYMCQTAKRNYENGLCPDCNEAIPEDAERGDSCENCEHVF